MKSITNMCHLTISPAHPRYCPEKVGSLGTWLRIWGVSWMLDEAKGIEFSLQLVGATPEEA